MSNKSASVLAGLACLPLTLSQVVRAQDTPVKASDSAQASERPVGDDTLEEVIVSAFLSDEGESAMKLDVPIRDTPFSVSNYSDAFMDAIDSTNVADLYQYMTGVTKGGQSAYDLSLRGFKTTSNDRNAIMTDGLPGQSARFGSPPTIGIDHIELVKGPASVLYGKAQPGGFVNIISKKPLDFAQAVFGLRASGYVGDELSLGDANGYSASADLTGPIDKEGRFLYRFVTEYGDKDSFRDFVYEESKYAAPSLTWNLSDSTSATLSGEYRWRKASQDFYLPAPNRDASLFAPITTRYQEPDDFQTEEGYVVGLAVAHEFANDATWKFAARSVRNDDESSWYDPIAVLPDLVTLQRRARVGHNQRKSDYFDTAFSLPFATGFVQHKALIGVTAGRDSLDANRKQFVNGATTGPLARPGPGSLNIDIYNPVYGVAPLHSSLPAGQRQRRFTESEAYGVYLTDFLTFSQRWKGTVGLRYDHEDQLFEETVPTPLPERTKSASGSYPMAGLLFQPNEAWTIYASYSTSFVPQAPNFQDAAGANPFQPEEGVQKEIGIKADLLNGRVNFTLALFDIKKKNTLALVTCNAGVAGTCMQEVGEETSQGAEIEMDLQPLSNWQTVLGYARVDAEIAKANTAASAPLEGSRLTNAPRDNAHLWSRYDFVSGALKNFSVGLGVVHVSEQPGNLPSRANSRVLILPDYTVADLAFYYTLRDRYDFTLKFGNLLDEVYYDSVGSTLADASVVPGAPRNVALSMNARF